MEMKTPEQMEAEWDEQMRAAGVPGEKQMRDMKAPSPETVEELATFIKTLVDRPHSYGTCVYAMSLAAVAAFNHVAKKLGVTGFQASCADMDILARTRGLKFGHLQDYDNLLFPQYCDDEHFPTWQQIIEKHKQRFADEARKLLARDTGAVEGVVAHWNWLASLAPEKSA
jgi:hypothetical protein